MVSNPSQELNERFDLFHLYNMSHVSLHISSVVVLQDTPLR